MLLGDLAPELLLLRKLDAHFVGKSSAFLHAIGHYVCLSNEAQALFLGGRLPLSLLGFLVFLARSSIEIAECHQTCFLHLLTHALFHLLLAGIVGSYGVFRPYLVRLARASAYTLGGAFLVHFSDDLAE